MDRVPDFESVGCAFESHRGYLKSKGIAWALSNPSVTFERKSRRMTNLVTWLAAPDWLTPSEAAALLGPGEDVSSILALMHAGAVDWEEIDGRLLIEKESLREYKDALWEALTYER